MNDTRRLQKLIDNGESLGGQKFLVTDHIHLRSGGVVQGPGKIIAASKAWPNKAHDGMGILNLDRVSDVMIIDIEMVGVKGQSHTNTPKLIYMRECERISVDQCVFSHCSCEGVWGGCNNSYFTGNRIHDVGIGGKTSKWKALPALQPFGSHLRIAGNVLTDCGMGTGATGSDIIVEHNIITGFIDSGLGAGDSPRMANGPAVIRNNYLESTSTGRRQRYIALSGGNPMRSVVVERNQLVMNSKHAGDTRGIYIGTCQDTIVRDNQIEWDGDCTAVEVHGHSQYAIDIESERNRLVSRSGLGCGIRCTPGKGCRVSFRSYFDSICGIDPLKDAATFSQFRGGAVKVCIEGMWVQSGSCRTPDGALIPVGNGRVWMPSDWIKPTLV